MDKMEVVAVLEIKDLARLDAKVKKLTELTLREPDEPNRQKLFEDLLSASEERQRAQGWNEALTSAQAEIERLTKERDEALLCQQEIAAGTSKSATVARIIIAKNEAEARAEAAEKERDALREFAESFRVSVNEDSFYKDVALHLISPHSLSMRIRNDSSKSWLFKDLEDRRLAALQPLEPKNDKVAQPRRRRKANSNP